MIGWLEGLAARRMVRPVSPTADLYFVNACGDWLAPAGPVTRLAPGVFASDETLLVVRHWGRAGRLPERRRRIWLIDDDIAAALRDPGLPPGQRLKLALFEARHGRALRAMGADVVASSETLAARLGGAQVLRPHWSEPLSDLAHQGQGGRLRIGYLGSAVHRGDLAFLAPALRALLERHPEAELHLAANHDLGPLDGHPRVRPFRETGWSAYRAALPGRRLHLALYPLLDTAANRARSTSKIVEHAVAGAAALYSEGWPEAARVARRGAGIVLENDPEAWAAAASRLLSDGRERRAIAARGLALARDLNHPGAQREFWRHAFGLAPSSFRLGGI